ncbi:glycosyltransferase family 2 protein [Labilibacter marinus]|uniref:glycosyltransferase family 2 protein n=1 Tax=Labilibacter marinus TaxID=1477105 RepID=UPI0008364FA2|nr:glycosyltransferase family 2 protein [Labilibacter marinus]
MNTLAIVVPCYNEQEVLPETTKRLSDLLDRMIKANKVGSDSYILYINDGSKDNTWPMIEELHQSNTYVKGLKLSRNVGHQFALLAGLKHVTDNCDAAVSIDADLQDDIEVIQQMVDRYDNGDEIVYGARSSRDVDTFFTKHASYGFYNFMRSLGVDSVYNHADFRLMSNKVLNHFQEYKESNLYIRGIIPQIGYNSSIVEYPRAERFAGESKYPISKLISLAINGITSFSIKPLRIVFWLGIITLILSILAMFYALGSYFYGVRVAGWTSVIISVWFLGSVILLALGVIGEYIGKIYTESKDRPKYFVEKTLFDSLKSSEDKNKQ